MAAVNLKKRAGSFTSLTLFAIAQRAFVIAEILARLATFNLSVSTRSLGSGHVFHFLPELY
jgi:hypothetical protein